MSKRLAELAGRKQLLLARSRLQRLELQHGAASLRESFLQPRNMLSMATSGPMKPLLFSVLMMVVGRGRLGRVLRGAMTALTVLRSVQALRR